MLTVKGSNKDVKIINAKHIIARDPRIYTYKKVEKDRVKCSKKLNEMRSIPSID
jgi:hypothetical protein